MIQRLSLGMLLVAATLACEKASPPAEAIAVAGVPPARAAHSPGDFPDNPLLAFVPVDTPYAFATFKPVPLDYVHHVSAMFGPLWVRALQARVPATGPFREQVDAVMKEIGELDLKRFEELGFSAKARMVVYGLGAYPVFRAELGDGDRVLAFLQRIAQGKLPAPTERTGHRYWILDLDNGNSLLFALAKKEVVLAFAPRALIDASIDALIGEQKPVRSLPASLFKTIAKRDGFTGQGVGFVDTVRVAGLIADGETASPDCRDAMIAIGKLGPRLGVGYDDLTAHRTTFGAVLEVAPDILADLRAIAGPVAGVDRLLDSKPMFGIAFAGNAAKTQTMLHHLARVLRDATSRCTDPSISGIADSLEGAASAPIPPALSGLHGLVVSLQNLQLAAGGPSVIDGWAVLRVDHAADLIKLATDKLPGLTLATDGKAHALPGIIPFPGHLAASNDSIALALGSGSELASVDVLKGAAKPAPLALFVADYARMGAFIPATSQGPDAASMRDLFKAFGTVTVQLLADERGMVTWWSLDMP